MRELFKENLDKEDSSIKKIKIPKSRDEFPDFLRALQHIFINKEIRETVLGILENKICTKKKTGRPGMDLWTIFVLASTRLCLDTDYDRVHYLANYDKLLRQIIGIEEEKEGEEDQSFERQTLIDNVNLLDEATLRQINEVIVKTGHGLVKKKETDPLHIKIDSFPIQANVHFPTDYNLLFDSGRKCIDVLKKLIKNNPSHHKGWRKINYWITNLKTMMLVLSRSTVDKSKNRKERIIKSATEYLDLAQGLFDKLSKIKPLNPLDLNESILFVHLDYYLSMLSKHIDLVNRRLLKEETIPHEEKIFSIFEPWVEWICKGKLHKLVDIGKNLCVSSDQWHFIVDWQLANHQQDNQMLISVIDRIRVLYETLGSCSGDKGYYSKADVELIELFEIEVCIPKKGRRSLADIERENKKDFIKRKRQHSAIESNINELQNRGLVRCPDKGENGMQRYVGLGVISYNLRRLGQVLLGQDNKAILEAIQLKGRKAKVAKTQRAA